MAYLDEKYCNGRVRVVESKLCDEYLIRSDKSPLITLYDFEDVQDAEYYVKERVLYLRKIKDEDGIQRRAIIDVPHNYKIFSENVPILFHH